MLSQCDAQVVILVSHGSSVTFSDKLAWWNEVRKKWAQEGVLDRRVRSNFTHSPCPHFFYASCHHVSQPTGPTFLATSVKQRAMSLSGVLCLHTQSTPVSYLGPLITTLGTDDTYGNAYTPTPTLSTSTCILSKTVFVFFFTQVNWTSTQAFPLQAHIAQFGNQEHRHQVVPL